MNCNPQSLASASACFDFCVSAGNAGPLKSYLWCQIANTKKFGGGGSPGFKFTTPTGFVVNSNILGTLLLSSWTIPPPAGVTGTEVWTSTDGTNYALFSTVLNPPGTQNFGAIAVGNFQWTKIRWTDGAGGFSDFTAPIQWSGQAMNWAARVNTNGGTLQSTSLISATNTMWCTLFNAGLSSHILALNPIAHNGNQGAGGLAAAETPLIKGPGSDPWGNHNANDTSVTANGFVGNGAIALLTGFIPTSFASDNNAGVSCYCFTAVADGNNYDWGGYDGANGIMSLHCNSGGNSLFDCFNLANRSTVVSPGVGGFYTTNRVAAADLRLYFGNSTNALAQVGATNVAAGSARSTINLDFGGLGQNNAGSVSLFTNHTLSFWAAHDGLSLADATTLFNAAQAMRVSYGGGFV